MTSSSEQTTALINEARSWAADPKPEPGEVVPALEFVDLVGRLADALEAATKDAGWEYRTLLDGYDPQPHNGLTSGHITVADWEARYRAENDERRVTLERRRVAGTWEPVGGTE